MIKAVQRLLIIGNVAALIVWATWGWPPAVALSAIDTIGGLVADWRA